jgi:hypothetical protein
MGFNRREGEYTRVEQEIDAITADRRYLSLAISLSCRMSTSCVDIPWSPRSPMRPQTNRDTAVERVRIKWASEYLSDTGQINDSDTDRREQTRSRAAECS